MSEIAKRIAMTYPLPPASIDTLRDHAVEGRRLRLSTERGMILEISFLEKFGWMLEVRYDLVYPNFFRQPLAARIAEFHLLELQVEEQDSQIVIRPIDGASSLTFLRKTGRFFLTENQHVVFKSSLHPFSVHPEGVQLWNGVQSMTLADLAQLPAFARSAGQSHSCMARFEYPCPEGLVLGLPGQSGEINRNGYRFELYNTDRPEHTPSRAPLYQSWPILFHADLEKQGWIGIFHDNPSRTFVDIGDFDPATASFQSSYNNTRILLCTGSDLAQVSHRMTTLLGTPAFPPAWAFGYQQCRWSYMNEDDILSTLSALHRNDYPCDAIYFDIDYMDGYRVFTRHPENFANLKKTLDTIHAQGAHAVCILDPGIKIDPNYHAFQAFEKQHGWLTRLDGSEFSISCWPEKARLPDFYNAEVRETWSNLVADWLKEFPFDGIWNDMNEPANWNGSNELVAETKTAEGLFAHQFNLYGMRMSEASAEGWRKAFPERRMVNISRSGYAGLSQHAVIWHGDNHAWWEHLRLAIDKTIGYSLCGAYYSGPDVPGFSQHPSDDLAVRFFQLGSMLPLFRGHAALLTKRKEPYAFGPEAQRLIRESLKLRYSLMREWYSGFQRSIELRRSPVFPVLAPGNVIARDQFLLFEKFLVAPVTERDAQMKLVYLPEGRWFPLGDTSQAIAGGRWIQTPVTLSSFPLFVREGSIIARNTPALTVSGTFRSEERFEAYARTDGSAEGYWYSDDGVSIRNDGARRKHLTLRNGIVTEQQSEN